MPRIEDVVCALGTLGEAGKAVLFPDAGEKPRAPGEELMRITLMPYVPDDCVARRVENPVQGDGKLDDPKVGGKVSTVRFDGFYDFLSYFFREESQLALFELLYVLGGFYAFQHVHVAPQ